MKRLAALLIAAFLSGWYFIGCVSASTAYPNYPPPQSVPTSSPVVPGSQAAPASPDITFSTGAGWADAIPHQIIRTADDRLYFFGIKGDSSSILEAYWTVSSGLPNSAADISGALQVDYGDDIISTDAVYDGSHIIHVLTNDQAGEIIDRPFDTSTNKFSTALVLGNNGATLSGIYVGTSGISGMMDKNSLVHIAYWSSGSHIIYRSYSYDIAQNALTLQSGPTQLDASGSANHPALAVSPKDNSVTVAWVSQAGSPARIFTRTYKSGSWGSIETASTSAVWTSTSGGINIDQGPSLVIGSDGTRYLAYIENWRLTLPYDYGRIHFVADSGSGWTDQYIGSYTHDPVLALNSSGQIYIIGHGYPLNSACTSLLDMCLYKRNSNGSWATPQVFLAHQGNQSFDSSTSVKWSAVGFNRPETIEFFFTDVGAGYDNPVLYYGRIGGGPSLGIRFFLPLLMR